jgi:hypothetical protein
VAGGVTTLGVLAGTGALPVASAALPGSLVHHGDDHGVEAGVAGDDGEEHHGDAAAGQPFGDAVDVGSMRGKPLAQPVVGMAPTTTGRGYWLVARDGGIFSFGDAAFHGSTGAMRLNQPIVGMTATPTGGGYWFVAADGGVFTFGDAVFRGSTGAIRLAKPIVGMAATATGRGYWLVAADGGVFTFGDAGFHGSAAPTGVRAVGIEPSPSGRGYWIAGDDGRVYAYGDARRLPSTVAVRGTGFAVTPTGSGYWLASTDGNVQAIGDAGRFGAADTAAPVVGMAPTPTGRGYWLVASDGGVMTRVGDGGGAYGFLSTTRDGTPMRFDACRPIRYVVNPDGAPAGAVQEIHDGFRRIAAATGLRFESAGSTTETHLPVNGGTRRKSYQPDRYGSGLWAPLLITWTTERQEPVLAGMTLGYGGATSYWLSSTDQAYVTGEVVFDRDLGVLRSGFGAGLTRGNLVLHELSHVLGLDHVADRRQLMNPSLNAETPDGFGAGDRAGLTRVGAAAGGCLRVASPTGGVLPPA